MPGLANARDLQMQDQHVAKVKTPERTNLSGSIYKR
jgi:hypothetical protein